MGDFSAWPQIASVLSGATLVAFFTMALPVAFAGVVQRVRHPLGQRAGLWWIGIAVLLLYLSIVARLTGIPTVWSFSFSHMGRVAVVPFADGFGPAHGLNLAMLVPFGVLVPVLWPGMRRWHRVLLASLALSGVIELTQLATVRLVSIEDLLLNTLGAILGFDCFKLAASSSKRIGIANARRPLSCLATVGLALLGYVLLFQPAQVTRFDAAIPVPTITAPFTNDDGDATSNLMTVGTLSATILARDGDTLLLFPAQIVNGGTVLGGFSTNWETIADVPADVAARGMLIELTDATALTLTRITPQGTVIETRPGTLTDLTSGAAVEAEIAYATTADTPTAQAITIYILAP